MRILIDTNVFIYRENDHIVPSNLQTLLVALGVLGIQTLVHPRSVEELEHDQDHKRREVVLSKIGTYSLLEFPPNPEVDEEFLERVGYSSKPNDTIDNAILYAVYRDAVRYLITEDREIQRKSERVGLRDRTLSIDEALQVFPRATDERSLAHPPALTNLPVHNLKLEDPFFDSLRKDYPEFDNWFKRVAQEGRVCLAYLEDNGKLGALMIWKTEEDAVHSIPPLPPKRRLKISTLQVVHRGYKIGELFVKLAVHEAVARRCEEVYLTHFVKPDDDLVSLIDEYGFEQVARNSRGEGIFVKQLFPSRERVAPMHPVAISQKYYPAFRDGSTVKKFLVPIRPEYHEKLFVDSWKRQTTLPEYRGEFVIPGNTIKKAYLCNSNNRTISKGDIMLFYRSTDWQEFTSIGVVESVHRRLRKVEDVARVVEKRTVYSIKEIQEMLASPTVVFLFIWLAHVPRHLKLRQLQQMGISVPQTISRVSHQKYLALKRASGIDERFTFD